MTEADLKKANNIKAELKELDRFIFHLERKPKSSLVSREQKMLFNSLAYGALESETLELSTVMHNRFKKILTERQEELKKQLEEL